MARLWIMPLMLAMAAASFGQGAGSNQRTDSATVTLEGCGVFQAVRVMVDGREAEARGVIRGGRTFLPARESLEMLGAEVRWVGAERSFFATIPDENRTIRVTVGSPVVRVYQYDPQSRLGAGPAAGSVRLNASPFICEGRVYAPVRAAAEAVGGRVHYDSRTRTVHVNAPRSNSAR